MNGSCHRSRIGILVLLVCLATCLSANGTPIRGEEIGPILATVARVDDERGLIVRSEPSSTARVMGRLPMGARINGYNQFSNGWMKIRTPIDGGWIEMTSLRPTRGDAVVISVDRPEMCLRIRNGPGGSYTLVGCAQKGDRLRLTGLGSDNNWAEIDRPVNGWVSLPQISTNLGTYQNIAAPAMPPPPPQPIYVEEPAPPVPTTTYVVPYGGYYYGGYYPFRPYWRHHYRPYWRHHVKPYGPYYRGYRGGGVGVRVGPRGGVGVRVGGVGVRVGPRGGVGVRVR